MKSLAERFWEKARRAEGCWCWIGSTNGRGYGTIGDRDRHLRAHRVSWELHNGPVPDGLQVLHHCDNPPCCNPAHLFLGTQGDNMRDAARKGRLRTDGRGRLTHCKRWHQFTAENTYLDGRGHRRCRACIEAYKSRGAATVEVPA